MKNITLTVNKQEYENREFAIRLGHIYYVKDDNGDTVNLNYISNLSQFDAIDSALLEVLYRASRGYYEADITIKGATLPESLKTHLTDKFELESQINSVTFE